jgi:hypothetical protein
MPLFKPFLFSILFIFFHCFKMFQAFHWPFVKCHSRSPVTGWRQANARTLYGATPCGVHLRWMAWLLDQKESKPSKFNIIS